MTLNAIKCPEHRNLSFDFEFAFAQVSLAAFLMATRRGPISAAEQETLATLLASFVRKCTPEQASQQIAQTAASLQGLTWEQGLDELRRRTGWNEKCGKSYETPLHLYAVDLMMIVALGDDQFSMTQERQTCEALSEAAGAFAGYAAESFERLRHKIHK